MFILFIVNGITVFGIIYMFITNSNTVGVGGNPMPFYFTEIRRD